MLKSTPEQIRRSHRYRRNAKATEMKKKQFLDELYRNQKYVANKEDFLSIATYVIGMYKRCYEKRGEPVTEPVEAED